MKKTIFFQVFDESKFINGNALTESHLNEQLKSQKSTPYFSPINQRTSKNEDSLKDDTIFKKPDMKVKEKLKNELKSVPRRSTRISMRFQSMMLNESQQGDIINNGTIHNRTSNNSKQCETCYCKKRNK